MHLLVSFQSFKILNRTIYKYIIGEDFDTNSTFSEYEMIKELG